MTAIELDRYRACPKKNVVLQSVILASLKQQLFKKKSHHEIQGHRENIVAHAAVTRLIARASYFKKNISRGNFGYSGHLGLLPNVLYFRFLSNGRVTSLELARNRFDDLFFCGTSPVQCFPLLSSLNMLYLPVLNACPRVPRFEKNAYRARVALKHLADESADLQEKS